MSLLFLEPVIDLEYKISSKDGTRHVSVFRIEALPERRTQRRPFERVVLNACVQAVFENDDIEIQREESGAPYLPFMPSTQISLSHSGIFFAVEWSEVSPVGLDVQTFQNKEMHKGRFYFVNSREEDLFELTERELYLIWSAKEAVYKYKKGDMSNYKESMTVLRIEAETLIVEVGNELIQCAYRCTEDYVLVFTI